MLWRYKDTSSIIQRHIATVSNIDKASNPYISSMVSISNNMIWYETEMKFVDQKERNVANEDSFLYILFKSFGCTPLCKVVIILTYLPEMTFYQLKKICFFVKSLEMIFLM